ncbi:MAG TPA: ATP-binding protein [Spirochaetota bacterium]|nr:ATP-binding protein [Spirochaetota bacterium]HPI90053.1 ATP-binding protein [Spirochaetota bacterium]HPR47840.1 ATP-binding protein [Spirochaetota bacterium]
MKLSLTFKSLESRIHFWLILLFIIVIFLIFMPSMVVVHQNIYDRESEALAAIRDIRVQEINNWVDRIAADLKTLSKSGDCYVPAGSLCRGMSQGSRDRDILKNILNNYLNNYTAYREFFIVSAANGRAVFSTSSETRGMDFSKKDYVRNALKSGEVTITNIYFSTALNSPTMTFAVPLGSPGMVRDNYFGVLVARINLDRSLYALLLDRSGLGETGEAVILSSELIALNKVQGYEGFPLKLKLKDAASFYALMGKTGTAECRDYRGKSVVAAYTSLPRLKWGIVVKKDLDEVFSGFYLLLSLCSGGVLFSLIIVYLVARGIGKNISEPVKALIRVSNRICEGDYNFRTASFRDDEISRLVLSYNRMVDFIMAQLNIQKISSDIIHIMVSTLSLEEFGKNVLKKFVEVTESSLGAFYILSRDGGEFSHLTSIGLDTKSVETFHAASLEGEFGRALATREISITRNISNNSMVRLRTIIGDVVPKEIMTIPVIVSNRTVAIVSLATLTEYPAEVTTILNQVRPVMNTAFSNILSDEETRRLAKELSEKNQLLESQKGELLAQAEELQLQSDRVQKQNVELEQQRLKVEEANKLKSEFLSNMSHELRTPLNSIVALSHVLLLQGKDKLTEEEMEYLEIIDRNSGKLLSLINDILDLSKIEAGRIDLKIKNLWLTGIVRAIVDNLEQIAHDKGIGLKLIVEGEIPAVESDESRVYQILQNIIGNAVKFTERGGVTITISADSRSVHILVVDTGIGINPAELPHIFEEFRQIDGTLSRKYDGTGLGLAIASKSAQLISGRITVSSKLNKGSRFEITIPLKWKKPEQLDEHELNNLNIKRDAALSLNVIRVEEGHDPHDRNFHLNRKKRKGKFKVLVVDDDSDNILAVRAILKERYRIYEAHDGTGAVSMAYREMPDLILLDMALPDKNGFTVVKELKGSAVTGEIPCIALTALTMAGDRERILEAGCDDYIPKPFTVQELSEKIYFWLKDE